MHSFRQKVFVSYIVLLVLFLAVMFPFVTNAVQQIVFASMTDCAHDITKELEEAQDASELVQMLKNRRRHIFYRVAILDAQRRVLYDSHKRISTTPFFPLQFVTHPEIEDALEHGTGYSEEYSHLLGQKLIYVAKKFSSHEQSYVIRIAFPFQYIQELRDGFTLGFLLFGFLILILFSALAVVVLNHFSSPIREIIKAVRGYREGDLSTLPHITLKTAPKDEFTYLANTLNSLSQRVRAEIEQVRNERNEKEVILESLADAVIAVDADFRVSYVNPTALYLLDLDSEIVGKPLRATLPPDCEALLEECCHQQILMSKELEIRREGVHLYLNIVATPRSFGGGAILVVHDRSAQHQMLEMRKAFIANASHELKTPITIIRGFAETIHDNPALDKKTLQEVTQRIVGNCKRMTSIIKNLLTLADIENLPSFRVSSHDIFAFVRESITRVQEAWPEAQVTLSPSQGPVAVDMDSTLMEIAFFNVLENAAKYSQGAAQIDVRISSDEQQVYVEIEDHGPGIPEKDLKHIFQRFYRVDRAHSSRMGGSGLGLSIVETIISKHFGKISVRSTLGKGTAFTISLPRNLSERLQSLE